MAYHDSGEERRHASRASQASGASYTDRFRADASFRQPTATVTPGTVSIPQILALVDRATDPRLSEPDLARNLQIADLINEKKGTAPREVAMHIAKLVNQSVAQKAVLALSVLDVAVKNCGYPFHLAISRRDFLNRLVRGFPERPPLHYSRVQTLILEMIEEWNQTIVKTSKYRDDLGHIRDMHRLLSYKGYMFPEISPDELAALTPEHDTLKSAAELEREDREAQSAKLQELIRSGTPQDLKEANRLMSVMAGFRESRIDYNAKVAAELDKVRRKAEILQEMLVTPPEKLEGGDVFEELANELKASLPKIKRILGDEDAIADDPEAETRIKNLQGTIEALVAKYDALKRGDPGAVQMPTTGSASSGGGALESLIDIGDDEPASSSQADDLLSLSFGGLQLGGGSSASSTPHDLSTQDILALGQPPASGSSSANQSLTSPLAGTPVSTTPASPSRGTLLGDDSFAEFAFSPVPATTAPTTASYSPLWSDNTLQIEYSADKQPGVTTIDFLFSNPGSKKVTNLEMQHAPPRSLAIEIGPLSSTQLEPHQKNGSKQRVVLKGSAAPKLRWKVNYNSGIESRSATADLKNI